MTIFIDLSSPEELYSDLINHVSYLRKKKGQEQQSTITEYQRLIDEQHPAEFLSKIITNETEFLFKESDKDIEGFFNIILTVLHKLEVEAINIISQKIRDCLSVNPTENSQLKIKILTNFFNSFSVKSPQRYEIFYVLIKLAAESNHYEFIKSQIKDLDLWLEDWSSNTKQKRKIYQLISNIFKEKNNMLSHQFLFKYLQTFTKDDSSEAQDDSVKACIEAISIPELYQSDYLLELPAIQYLEKSTVRNNQLTFELMKIFATEQLESFLVFQSQHPEFLQTIGLKTEPCLQKIRLLSLATLTAEQSRVSYALISKNLKIEEDQVESWVINAIAGELIDAKLDQLNRVVNVNSSTQRVFNKSQWEQLGQRFGAWRSSVKTLLQVIETAKNTQVKPFYFQSR